MKKTTKILIGMTALPFVLILLFSIILLLSGF